MGTPLTASAEQSIFELPDERGKSSVKWARWLAYAEGVILLMGSCMIISRSGPHNNQLAIGAAALAALSIILGWQVGRGSTLAAMLLLGMSASRGIMTFIPNAPEWWTTFPPLTILELFVYGLAARGAFALARSKPARNRALVMSAQDSIALMVKEPKIARSMATAQRVAPVVRPSDQTPPFVKAPEKKAPVVEAPVPGAAAVGSSAAGESTWIGPRIESHDTQADIEDRIRAGQPLIDFTVAGILGVVSLFLAMTRIPSHSEGLMGLGETLEVMYGVIHLVLAGLLFFSAMGAQAQKRWAILLRACIYYLLVAEGLFWVKVVFAGHGIKLS